MRVSSVGQVENLVTRLTLSIFASSIALLPSYMHFPAETNANKTKQKQQSKTPYNGTIRGSKSTPGIRLCITGGCQTTNVHASNMTNGARMHGVGVLRLMCGEDPNLQDVQISVDVRLLR